jgi:hypothetical protein
MIRGLVVVLAMAACAQGAELEDPQLAGPFVLHQAQAEPAPCGMAFDPAPELLAATDAAAERWSAATGCDVRVEAGGLPVRAQGFIFAEELPNGLTRLHAADPELRYHELCGATLWRDGGATAVGIVIGIANEGCDPAEGVAHEMGHRLAAKRGHSERGLMAGANETGRTGAIDESSLVWVCETLPCSTLTAE